MLSDMGDIPIVVSEIPIVMLSDIPIVTKQHAGPSISLRMPWRVGSPLQNKTSPLESKDSLSN